MSDKSNSDSKIVAKKITIGAKIDLFGMVQAGVEYIKSKIDWDNAKESNTGDYSAAEVSGKDSIAIVTGRSSKARGALGCWLVLTERDADWHIKEVQAVKVDGEKIKADTWYQPVNGKIKECE